MIALAYENKELFIDSEKLVIENNKNIATFTGNVLICFNNIKLITQTAIVHFEDSENKKIKLVIMPHKLKALILNQQNSIILSDNALYTMQDGQLLLKGNVIIQNKTEIIKTNSLTYYDKLRNIVIESE